MYNKSSIKLYCTISSLLLLVGCNSPGTTTSQPTVTEQPVPSTVPTFIPEQSVSPTPTEKVTVTKNPDVGQDAEQYENVSVGGLFEIKVAKELPEELSFIVNEWNTDEHKVGNFGIVRTISACAADDFEPMCEQGWIGYCYGDVPLIEAYPEYHWFPDDTPETAIASFVGSDGVTYYVWENPGWYNEGEPIEAFKEDTTQWFVDYLNDPNSLPQIYHPENIIRFNN